MLSKIVIVILSAFAISSLLYYFRQRKLKETCWQLKKKYITLQSQYEEESRAKRNLLQEIKILELKREEAAVLAEKDLQIENEKRKIEYSRQLDLELKELKENHPLFESQKLLEELSSEIENKKNVIRILQQKDQEKEEQENFVKMHSLSLTLLEKSDISLIRSLVPKLSKKTAINKLIWSEFYQKKLQVLRKNLEADKTTGIYKITNIKNGKIYIGQSVDIGERWTQHIKVGLGVETDSAATKFYTSLIEDGPESFTYEVLEVCDKKDLNAKERYWIDFYNTVSKGYNTR